ncbi:NitT/TauT family transport system substrate-binding protein [Paracoccus thiocyanatus]|uniref:Thiamine pyrimidine synthase n=1 Tax=Paracoccus thiocyanatus TaxID=34006 RepID=A0A1N6W2V0_9RHOB|nr:ABC transporter substrate-binding protein [Paracoccus thiocyanatus]SIQ84325.1 NitT/TauT family transport system substrate-binding protein [Paracoccus thiocyanatus]
MTKMQPLSVVAALLVLAAPALADEKLTVRLDFSPWGSHAAMHLAKHNGWFKEAGLDVDVQDGRGSGNTLQLVNAGQVDVGQIQLGLIPAARQGGAHVKGVADWARRTDLCVLVDKDAPIEKVADLKGMSLVVFAASPWAPYIDTFLAAGGLDRNNTTVEFVDASALWGTYTAGRADGLMSTVSSALPLAEATRPSKCLTSDMADLYFPSYGLVASDDTIKNRPDALKKLIAVQQRAWAELAKNPDLGVEAMQAERPDAMLNADILREQIRLTIEYFDTPATEGKPIGWQATEDWEAALKGMERAGVVPAGWNVNDYFTNEMISE